MANVNNYIAAGANAVKASTQMLDSLAKTAPNYTGIATESIKQEAANRANKLNNEGKQVYAQERADLKVSETEKEIDTLKVEINEDRKRRMAGKLAAGAKLIGVSQILKNRKDEPNPIYDSLQGQIDYYTNLNKKSLAETEDANNRMLGLKDKPKGDNSSTASTPDTMTVPTGDQSPQTGSAAWQKLGNTIAFGEGTTGDKGYTTQFTGTQFSGFGDHPRQLRASGSLESDASGKYQFLSTTWDGAKNALGLTDFSPASQEAAGRYLTQKRGVDPDKPITTIDEFKAVMDKLSPEWASLPTAATGTSYYGQGGKTLQQLWDYHQSL